jgi:hypothetical protein
MTKHITSRAAKTIIAAIISTSACGAMALPCITATTAATAAHSTVAAASANDTPTPPPASPDNGNPWA